MKKPNNISLYVTISCCIAAILIGGCSSPAPVPKPRGYPRLTLPPVAYQKFENSHCPYTFEYPVSGVLETQRIDSCFFNIRYPEYDCKWYLTLRVFGKKGATPAYAYEDFRQVVYKAHAQKGTIYERPLRTPEGVGTMYELFGQTPTPAQLYFTDSSHFAVMASCYFNTSEKNDSLQPVILRMKDDMQHFIQTLRWK